MLATTVPPLSPVTPHGFSTHGCILRQRHPLQKKKGGHQNLPETLCICFAACLNLLPDVRWRCYCCTCSHMPRALLCPSLVTHNNRQTCSPGRLLACRQAFIACCCLMSDPSHRSGRKLLLITCLWLCQYACMDVVFVYVSPHAKLPVILMHAIWLVRSARRLPWVPQ